MVLWMNVEVTMHDGQIYSCEILKVLNYILYKKYDLQPAFKRQVS